MTIHAALEKIWEQEVYRRPQFSAQWLPVIDSTNSELMRSARAGNYAPQLLVVDQQTQGRGRLGRQWQSLPHEGSLIFSLGLVMHCSSPTQWSGLSLMAGVCVAQTLPQGVCLKWPNDIWAKDAKGDFAKLGGILVETQAIAAQAAQHIGVPEDGRYVVIGVGLNILKQAPTLRAGAVNAISLEEIAESQIDAPNAMPPTNSSRAALLISMVQSLLDAVSKFEEKGFVPWHETYATFDALKGRIVRLHSHENMPRSGMISHDEQDFLVIGVDVDGALLLQKNKPLTERTDTQKWQEVGSVVGYAENEGVQRRISKDSDAVLRVTSGEVSLILV